MKTVADINKILPKLKDVCLPLGGKSWVIHHIKFKNREI